MDSFTFLLVHCGSLVSTLVLSSETECPVALQWSPTPVGMVRLVCSLKRFPSGRLVSPMYTCAGSWSHVISYMSPHFLSFGVLSFGVLSFGCTRMDRRVFKLISNSLCISGQIFVTQLFSKFATNPPANVTEEDPPIFCTRFISFPDSP